MLLFEAEAILYNREQTKINKQRVLEQLRVLQRFQQSLRMKEIVKKKEKREEIEEDKRKKRGVEERLNEIAEEEGKPVEEIREEIKQKVLGVH
jgi:DNA anti-recombination protein RmuC